MTWRGRLDNKALLEIYKIAIELKVDKDFISLIEDELLRRGIVII